MNHPSGDANGEKTDLVSSIDEVHHHLHTEKRQTIIQACHRRDLSTLVSCADSPHGFIDDDLRRIAWPLLLGCVDDAVTNDHSATPWQSWPSHRDEEQVQRDVDRAFVYYPSRESDDKIQSNKIKLFNLITRVLRAHRMLCYFQGYHDIVQVLLLVLGETDAYSVAARLSLCRIRDYMLPSITPAVKHLRLIPAILQLADSALAERLSHTEPFFALSATLTLYAHDIQEYSDIARLYDFILAHEPVMTIYLFAAIVLSRRQELMEIPIAEPEMLHFTLSKLPQPLDLDNLISTTLNLFQAFPPESLPGRVWQKLSPYSVLKTARTVGFPQDYREAERLFGKQERQLAWEERLKNGLVYLAKHKLPLASVGSAVLVGALAIWLQRNSPDRSSVIGFWHIFSTAWRGS